MWTTLPLSDLELEIIQYDEAIKLDPDHSGEYFRKLNYRLSKWADTLDIVVCVAQNEQLPWTEGELGYPTRPMFLKSESGAQQVGDYHFYVNGRCGSLLVERKTCQDFYGTMFGNRDRFYREIDRYQNDPRFTQFVVVVECEITQWLQYLPPSSNSKTALVPQKLASLASLLNRGTSVFFAGDRTLATRFYRDCIRQWCLKNFKNIILSSIQYPELPQFEPYEVCV